MKIHAPNAAEAIQFAALASRATLLRHVLRRLPGGGYQLIRTAQGMHRELATLEEMERLLDLIAADARTEG